MNAKNRRNNDVGEGLFPMSFISNIQSMSISEAKQKCIDHVRESTATTSNKAKAIEAVSKQYDINRLMICLSNFNLSHQGYGVS